MGVPSLQEVCQKLDQIEDYYESVDWRGSTWSGRGKDFCYGETHTWRFLELLEEVQLHRDDVFVDLGCGTGRLVLAASLFCRRSVGVEVAPGLCDIARRAREGLACPNTDIRCEDVTTSDLSEGTIFYAFSTTWTDALREGAAHGLAHAPRGARVLTVDQPFVHPAIRLERVDEFEWYLPTDVSPPHVRKIYFQVRDG